MGRSNANISRNHGFGSDITGAATPRRGWIWYRGAIRRTGEAMTCGSPSVSRFRPHPGYIHRLPHPCHVLSLDRASPRDHTYVHRYTPYGPLFRGIWICTRKMHPYLTGIRENEQSSRCKFLWKPASTSSRRMEGYVTSILSRELAVSISHEWSNIDLHRVRERFLRN